MTRTTRTRTHQRTNGTYIDVPVRFVRTGRTRVRFVRFVRLQKTQSSKSKMVCIVRYKTRRKSDAKDPHQARL